MERKMQPGPAARFWLKGLALALSCVPLALAATNSVIWKSGDQVVQLADQDDAAVFPNDHPVTTTPNEIADLFRVLRIRYADEDAETATASIFTPEEIDNLGRAIATGLGRAGPSQDIIFHVIGAHRASPGAWLKRNRVSTGRVFFRDGHINVIFGQIQTPYRKKNRYGQTNEDFYPRVYGSRNAVADHDVILLTTAGIQLYQNDGVVRNDWVVISPDAAIPVVARKEPDARPAAVAAPVAEIRERSPEPSMPVAENRERSSEPVMPVARKPDTGIGQSKKSDDRSIPATTDIERRLEELKRLRERGLVSEEVYQAKMKEILQDL
jgi:hypothetical protein